MELNSRSLLLGLAVFAFAMVYFTAPVSAAEFNCAQFTNTSCDKCTDNTACYWCKSTLKCSHYPGWTKVVPHDCPHKSWYYGQCRLSGFVLMILVPSLVAFFLIFFGCCIYCCCCRRCTKWKKKRHDKEEMKMKRKKDEMQALHSQRKGERQAKAEDIRKKYGLLPSKTSGYERLDNN